MLEFKNGSYRFGDFHLSIDFRINACEIVCMLGPSGAGKSTILNIIAGFEKLEHGSFLIDRKLVDELVPAQRPVSMIFQDNNTFAHLTAFENVALGNNDTSQVHQALERVGISHLSDRRPGNMSGGERQRIAIARALVRNKPILLLDEAFAALGPGLRKNMLLLIKELATEKRLTVAMVTHNPEDAKVIADRVIYVDAGRAGHATSVDDFFTSRDNAIRGYLG